MLVRTVRILDKIERAIIVILFVVMVLSVFSQVVNRNLLKLNISWFEEVARGCMVYVLMFATEIGLRDHSQINIDSVVRRLPTKAASFFEHVSSLAIIVFTGLVGYTSIELIKTQYEVGAITPALGISTCVFQLSVTIGCVFIVFTQVIYLVNSLLKRKIEKKEAEAE